jgi:hypothetical protein
MLQPWPIAKAYSQEARSALSSSRSWSRSCIACLCSRSRASRRRRLASRIERRRRPLRYLRPDKVVCTSGRPPCRRAPPKTRKRPAAPSLRSTAEGREVRVLDAAARGQNSPRPTVAARDPGSRVAFRMGHRTGSPERPRDSGGSRDPWWAPRNGVSPGSPGARPPPAAIVEPSTMSAEHIPARSRISQEGGNLKPGQRSRRSTAPSPHPGRP